MIELVDDHTDLDAIRNEIEELPTMRACCAEMQAAFIKKHDDVFRSGLVVGGILGTCLGLLLGVLLGGAV